VSVSAIAGWELATVHLARALPPPLAPPLQTLTSSASPSLRSERPLAAPSTHAPQPLPPPSASPPPPVSAPDDDDLVIDLGAHAMPVLGEAQRWRRDDERGILFNMRNRRLPSPSFDTACGTIIAPIPHADAASYHVVQLAPYFSRTRAQHGNLSIVHHMDLFLCDSSVVAPHDNQCMSTPYLSAAGPCFAMVWAYDKGALRPYSLPSDAGLRVGRGTRFTTMLLFVHYGLPYGGVSAQQLHEAGYSDSSGVRVSLARRPRSVDAWSFEFMQTNMAIPAHTPSIVTEFTSRMPAEAVEEVLGADIALGEGAISLRQVHAHAHHHAIRVSLLRLRDGRWSTLLELSPYCGYGECQRFHNLTDADLGGAPPQLRLGDALEFRCHFTNDEAVTLHYGLSAAMEMCGAIIVYTPHAHRYIPTWHGGNDGVQRMVGPAA